MPKNKLASPILFFSTLTLASTATLVACGSDPAGADDGASGEMGDVGSESGGASGSESGDSTSTETGGETGEYDGVLEGWCSAQPEDFSFFVTSMDALWTLAGDPVSDLNGGFGGNFGGIAGADAICQEIGDATGNGHKTWRAFLSATDDGSGSPVNAIERIGEGPWYDANGRLVATGLAGLAGDRPDGDAQSTDDLPNECGVPLSALGDSHDVPTGSNKQGMLNSTDPNWTCNDWTSSDASVGVSDPVGGGDGVMIGHSFPREGGGGGPGGDGANWVSDHATRGCSKGANLIQNGPGEGTCIGCSGGYGAVYCFAL
jgi:hypothetical protein